MAVAVNPEKGNTDNEKKEKGEPPKKVSLGTLYRYATAADYAILMIGLLASAIGGGAQPMLMFAFGDVVGSLSSSTNSSITDLINDSLMVLIYVSVGTAACFLLQYWLVPLVAARQVERMRLKFFESVLRQDLTFFDARNPGDLAVMINQSANEIETGLSKKLSEYVMASFQGIFGMVGAFYFSWRMSLVLLAFIPALGAAAYCTFTLAGGDAMEKRKTSYSKAAGIASEAFEAIRTVQSFSGEISLAKKYSSFLGIARDAAIKFSLKGGAAGALMISVMFLMYGGGFWYGGYLISSTRVSALANHPPPTGYIHPTNMTGNKWYIQGTYAEQICKDFKDNDDAFASCACDIPWTNEFDSPMCGCSYVTKGLAGENVSECMDVGKVLIAFFCLIVGGFSLGQIGPAAEAMAKARISAYGIFEIIDMKPGIDAEKEGRKLPKDGKKGFSIEFRDVEFAYKKKEGEETRTVFKGLNFKIEAGQTVAFCGESGSGKSTIGKLCARLYDPDFGSVLIDGSDARDLDLTDLRNNVGVVSQEPLLFDVSVEENIALGVVDKSVKPERSEIVAAAEAANAHQFIEAFPDGYATRVGLRGSKLSGGQKQRVAIARGLIRDTPILVLDEATSALDMESERKVQDALEARNKKGDGKTIVIIAHRLSTVRTADKIIVLGEGDNGMGGGTKIVEQGTHDELMAMKGTYYALVGTQGDDESGTRADRAASVASEKSSVGGDAVEEGNAGAQAAATQQSGGDEEKEELTQEEADKEELKNIYKVPASRIWKHASDKKISVALGCICALASGFVWPGLGLVFGEMLTAFTEYETEKMNASIMQWALFFFGISIAQFFIQTGLLYFFAISGEAIVLRIRELLFKSLLRQDISFFDDPKHSSGALNSLLGTDAVYIQLVTGQQLGSILSLLVTLIFGLVIAFVNAWQLALALLGAMPILGASQAVANSIMIEGEQGKVSKLSRSSAIVTESASAMREVQTFGLQGHIHSTYAEKLRQATASQGRAFFCQGLGMGVGQGFGFGFYAFAFWYGGYLIDEGAITFDAMMNALFVLGFAAGGMGQAGTFAGDQAKAKVASSRIFRVIDRKPDIDTKPWTDDFENERTEYGSTIENLGPRIELGDVTFSYPMRDVEIFNKLNLTIEKGQTVALVGTSGSGKSTVIQLLERFYDPGQQHTSEGAENVEVKVEGEATKVGKYPTGEGTIMIDGVDLRSVDAKWWRENVGLVGQEPRLFYGTIAENIAMGKAGATEEQVKEAAKAANAHDFITAEGGYDRQVGAGGNQLSGGQKQRIAIARAIIKNPKLLLLDEATSALDNESEKIVQASLDKLVADSRGHRTTVIVAHRLSTIKNCDVIFVLENDWENGKGSNVVEKGTHDELMQKNGKYAALRRAFDGGKN